MAVLGKIRGMGPLLVGVIGLGLFSFIAEEAFRSCDSTKNIERMQVAEVLGEKLSQPEFQAMVDEYTEVIKLQQGIDNLTDEQRTRVNDEVWSTYVQYSLIEGEAKELGLTVTDEELLQVLKEGKNDILRSTPFFNPQTGTFDYSALNKFYQEYKKAEQTNSPSLEQMRPVYNYCRFIEKTLRQQLLSQKYQALFAGCFLSNKVEAKQVYEEDNMEAAIELAAFPYESVQEKDVQITEDDLKAKYKEMKPRFRQYQETRAIKYVVANVLASPADCAALNAKIHDLAAQLAVADDPSEVVRKSSKVPYLGVPVLKTAFPSDIQAQLDSMAVGTTSDMKQNQQDNTLNVVRLISKQELPDSVEFQAIQIVDANVDDAHTRADSVVNALKADASQWDALAKKYGQSGEKQWITTQQYQYAQSLDAATKDYLVALNTMSAGEMRNIPTNTGNIIVKVTERKSFKTKYVAAVIKADIAFSNDTHAKEYDKFSQFVSESQDIEALEKGAKKYGYQLQELTDMASSQHLVANIPGTHEALKWVFNEAEEGQISPLYECGDHDMFLVVALTKVHEKGYLTLDDSRVKELVKAEVLKDKKAEKLMEKASGVKSIADAKAKGAQVTPIQQITFSAPTFVVATGATEPAISGAVSATEKGKMSAKPVKGNAGVYVFQVTDKKNRAVKFDEKTYTERQTRRAMQHAYNYMQELYINANVKDNRYLFY